jgi:PAS domain S-box-containing protein/putative nucleotidyltransferase with HDIG domain
MYFFPDSFFAYNLFRSHRKTSEDNKIKQKGDMEVSKSSRHRKAEEAFEENERYRILIENTKDIVYSLDAEGMFRYVGPQVAQYGLDLEEVMSHNFLHFIHPKDREAMLFQFQKTLAEGAEFISQFRIKNRKGRIYWIEEHGKIQRDESGGIIGINGVLRDMTERKRVDEKLRRAHRELEMKVKKRTSDLVKANEAMKENTDKIQRALEGTIHALALTVEKRDPYTAGHQQRVAHLACAIASEMGFPEEKIMGIRMVGFIHDLGKIYVPAEILSKPGQLNEVEFRMIRSHAKVGYDILKKVEFPWPIAQVIAQHHERMDGSGYPSGLSGENILLEARIIGVADVFEAIASHRPYRPALGLDKALEEVSQKRGTLYDPEVVDACLRLFTVRGFSLEC